MCRALQTSGLTSNFVSVHSFPESNAWHPVALSCCSVCCAFERVSIHVERQTTAEDCHQFCMPIYTHALYTSNVVCRPLLLTYTLTYIHTHPPTHGKRSIGILTTIHSMQMVKSCGWGLRRVCFCHGHASFSSATYLITRSYLNFGYTSALRTRDGRRRTMPCVLFLSWWNDETVLKYSRCANAVRIRFAVTLCVCLCIQCTHKAYEGEIRFLLNENKMSEI